MVETTGVAASLSVLKESVDIFFQAKIQLVHVVLITYLLTYLRHGAESFLRS
jgi:hypothetical protein